MPRRKRIIDKIYYQGGNDNKIRIFILCDFWTTKDAMEVMDNVFLKGRDNYSDYITFVEDNSFTHIVIICGMNSFSNFIRLKKLKKIPKENVIAFANEPLEYLNINKNYINHVEKYCHKYIIGKLNDNLPKNFVTYYPFLCHPWERENYFNDITPKKKFFMSFPYSGSLQLEGHKYRKKLIDAILETDLDIHIWGKGCKLFKPDKRLKGTFEVTHGNVIEDYEFIIHTENSQSDDYISDKLPACIAFNTITLYWGAKNVTKYFGEKPCLFLSGDVDKDLQLLKDIFREPDKYRINLKEARKELFTGKAYFMKFLYDYWILNNKEIIK